MMKRHESTMSGMEQAASLMRSQVAIQRNSCHLSPRQLRRQANICNEERQNYFSFLRTINKFAQFFGSVDNIPLHILDKETRANLVALRQQHRSALKTKREFDREKLKYVQVQSMHKRRGCQIHDEEEWDNLVDVVSHYGLESQDWISSASKAHDPGTRAENEALSACVSPVRVDGRTNVYAPWDVPAITIDDFSDPVDDAEDGLSTCSDQNI
jgi:hypothetical protein